MVAAGGRSRRLSERLQLIRNDIFSMRLCDAGSYIENTFVDTMYVEWFSRVAESGKPYRNLAKADSWKCPYNNARACFEIMERLKER